MTAGRGCDNVVEVPEAQPRRNEVGRLPCLKYSTAFGMDVHLRSTTVCALDADTGEAVTRRFPGNPWGEVAGVDGSGFPGPSLAAYESGYLGFAPQRELSGLGVDCVVAAVSKIPRSAADLGLQERQERRRQDGQGDTRRTTSPPYGCPPPRSRGIRDLAGAYDGATARLATAKQRLLAFLATRGLRLRRHHARRQPEEVLDLRLPEVARQGPARRRRRRPGARRPEERGRGRGGGPRRTCSPSTGPPSRCQPDRRGGRAALQSIKGCAFALAAAFSAEVGDFTRFRSGRQVTSYFGLAPKSEVECATPCGSEAISGAGQRARQEVGSRGVLELRPGEPPTEADAQGQRRPARGEDAREEGFRAPAPAPRGDARQGHARRRRRTPPPPPSS